MCTGRVDPTLVAEAFLGGADGVMVVGCHFGECHYITGNYQGKVKTELAGRALEYVGLNPARVAFKQCSSAEGERFAGLVTDFHAAVKELGPLGQGDRLPTDELKEKLRVAKTALAAEKLRWVVGKFTVFQSEGNKYGERFTEHEMWRTLDTIILDEVATHEILRELKEGPVSVQQLAARLEMDPPRVLRYVLALVRRGLADMDGVKDRSPVYILAEKSRADAA